MECKKAPSLEGLLSILETAYVPVGTERKMQQAVESLLIEHGATYAREVKIGRLDRVDFLCDTTGIETKISGSHFEVAEQLLRYSQSPLVDGLILVTNRVSHRKLDGLANERNIPIRVVFVAFNGF